VLWKDLSFTVEVIEQLRWTSVNSLPFHLEIFIELCLQIRSGISWKPHGKETDAGFGCFHYTQQHNLPSDTCYLFQQNVRSFPCCCTVRQFKLCLCEHFSAVTC